MDRPRCRFAGTVVRYVMSEKQHILFVCTANQQRSPTAEELYRNDSRFEVRSAGTSTPATTAVSAELVEWADTIVTMEQRHAKEIRLEFPKLAAKTRFIVLGIPDIYEYMDPTLQGEIRDKFEAKL